jgi:hypothetical protein
VNNINDGNLRPLPREALRDPVPDAVARSGYKSNLAF